MSRLPKTGFSVPHWIICTFSYLRSLLLLALPHSLVPFCLASPPNIQSQIRTHPQERPPHCPLTTVLVADGLSKATTSTYDKTRPSAPSSPQRGLSTWGLFQISKEPVGFWCFIIYFVMYIWHPHLYSPLQIKPFGCPSGTAGSYTNYGNPPLIPLEVKRQHLASFASRPCHPHCSHPAKFCDFRSYPPPCLQRWQHRAA